MLQQILDQMYIDPELLNELSEDQKQMLFVKMREEQVRRWKVHEDKMDAEEKKNPKKTQKKNKKNVTFAKGKDGCERVWVMGDHKDDKTIEQILEEEAQEKARKQAEEEVEALRQKEEAERLARMEEERQRVKKENEAKEAELKRQQEEAALYQSIKEARIAVERMEIEKKKLEEEEQARLREIEIQKFFLEQERKAKRKSMELIDSVRQKRSSEIFDTLQKKRLTMVKLAEEKSQEVETVWKEQEKKVKQADEQIREIARAARREYRESLRRSFTLVQAAQALTAGTSQGKKPPLPPKKHLIQTSAPGLSSKKPRPLRPKGHDMIINWFQKEEKVKGSGLDPETGKVADWFHGIINRAETEELLGPCQHGSYLVRVSERVWGYTLSYKETSSRFKHFLIDASDLGYQFFGADQTVHESLADLVNFHKTNPITISGQEKLTHPCGQSKNPPDHYKLFHDTVADVTAL